MAELNDADIMQALWDYATAITDDGRGIGSAGTAVCTVPSVPDGYSEEFGCGYCGGISPEWLAQCPLRRWTLAHPEVAAMLSLDALKKREILLDGGIA